MKLPEIRAELHKAYVALAAALVKRVIGESVTEFELESLQTRIDRLEAAEHALQRVEELSYAATGKN